MFKQVARRIKLKKICFICDRDGAGQVRNNLQGQQAYALDCFSDLDFAIEAFKENEYDVLIIEVVNKVIVRRIIHSIRQSEGLNLLIVPILVIGGAKSQEELQRLEVDSVLLKPFSNRALDDVIATLSPKARLIEASSALVFARNVVPIKHNLDVVAEQSLMIETEQHTQLPPLSGFLPFGSNTLNEISPAQDKRVFSEQKSVLSQNKPELSPLPTKPPKKKKLPRTGGVLDNENVPPLSMMESIQKQQINNNGQNLKKSLEKRPKPSARTQADIILDSLRKADNRTSAARTTDEDIGSSSFSEKKKNRPSGNFSMPIKSQASSGAGRTKGLFILLLLVLGGAFLYFDQRILEVDVVPVRQAVIESIISVPGRVVSKRNIDVRARAAGQVVEMRVLEGDYVKKGQLIARLADKEAKSDVKRETARLESSQEEVASSLKAYERLKHALDFGAVTRRIVEEAETAFKTASARHREIEEELIKAKVKLDYLQIKAPFDGVVSSLAAQEGLWLALSERVLTLVDVSQRVVEFLIDEKGSARLNIGQGVLLSAQKFSDQFWEEEIKKIDEELNDSGRVKVQTSLGKNLRIGLQVDVELRVSSRENALQLPHETVFFHEGKPHVAIVENGKVVFIPVVTGIEGPENIEIVAGLRTGQNVIVSGGLLLAPGLDAEVN